MTNIDICDILNVGDNMEMVDIFKALGDSTRLEIIRLLLEGEKCACMILEDVPCVQSTLSHHLKILADAQVIKTRRAGKWIHYSINIECAKAIEKFGIQLEESCAEKSNYSCECEGE